MYNVFCGDYGPERWLMRVYMDARVSSTCMCMGASACGNCLRVNIDRTALSNRSKGK